MGELVGKSYRPLRKRPGLYYATLVLVAVAIGVAFVLLVGGWVGVAVAMAAGFVFGVVLALVWPCEARDG